MARDFESMEFDKSNNMNSSEFVKLNDSLIKNREAWKDRSIRKESFKQILSLDKKKSDSFFLRADSDVREGNLSPTEKNIGYFDGDKPFLENRPKSFKDTETFKDKLVENERNDVEFDPAVPSEDFFEEKGSESIIERNDEDSKFVDDESYSMVYLTKQQNSNIRSSIGSKAYTGLDNNKALSEIEDVENSIEHIEDQEDLEKEDVSKDKNVESIHSISNINSPFLKADSIIEASEIKDAKKIISEMKSGNEGSS